MKLSIARLAAAGLAIAVAAAAADAPAQPPAPAPSAPPTPTQSNMRQVGGALRAAMTELNKEAPDAAVVKAAATKLDTLAGQLPSWFATPSPPGAPTTARPEVWSDAAGFAAAAKALQVQTGKFAQLADGPDWAAAKVQAASIPGGPCKACHDKYRLPERK